MPISNTKTPKKLCRSKRDKGCNTKTIEERNGGNSNTFRKQNKDKKFNSTAKRVQPRNINYNEIEDLQSGNNSIADSALILSHGTYLGNSFTNKNTFVVPMNISLIQYTNPRQEMGVTDAEHLVRNFQKKIDLESMQPPYRINKSTGEIFKPDGKIKRREPLSKIEDFNLEFYPNRIFESLSLDMTTRIIEPDGSVLHRNVIAYNVLLSDMLSDMSVRYESLYPGKVINVFQLSCRSEISPSILTKRTYHTLDELADDFETVSMKYKRSTMSMVDDYNDYHKNLGIKHQKGEIENKRRGVIKKGEEISCVYTYDEFLENYLGNYFDWVKKNFENISDPTDSVIKPSEGLKRNRE